MLIASGVLEDSLVISDKIQIVVPFNNATPGNLYYRSKNTNIVRIHIYKGVYFITLFIVAHKLETVNGHYPLPISRIAA